MDSFLVGRYCWHLRLECNRHSSIYFVFNDPTTKWCDVFGQKALQWLACFSWKRVSPDWAIYGTLGNFSKPVATISLLKSPTFLKIIFGQLLWTFGDFLLVTLRRKARHGVSGFLLKRRKALFWYACFAYQGLRFLYKPHSHPIGL